MSSCWQSVTVILLEWHELYGKNKSTNKSVAASAPHFSKSGSCETKILTVSSRKDSDQHPNAFELLQDSLSNCYSQSNFDTKSSSLSCQTKTLCMYQNQRKSHNSASSLPSGQFSSPSHLDSQWFHRTMRMRQRLSCHCTVGLGSHPWEFCLKQCSCIYINCMVYYIIGKTSNRATVNQTFRQLEDQSINKSVFQKLMYCSLFYQS